MWGGGKVWVRLTAFSAHWPSAFHTRRLGLLRSKKGDSRVRKKNSGCIALIRYSISRSSKTAIQDESEPRGIQASNHEDDEKESSSPQLGA